MSGFEYFKDVVFNKYAKFNGRARRAEYWNFVLYQVLLLLPLYVLGIAFMDSIGSIFFGLYGLASLALIIPALAVCVRRLQDTNRSPWMILLGLIPIVGGIILLVFFVQEGTIGTNQYGPDPKRPGTDNEIQDILV